MNEEQGTQTQGSSDAGQTLTPEELLQKEKARLEMKHKSELEKAVAAAKAAAREEFEAERQRAEMGVVERLKAEAAERIEVVERLKAEAAAAQLQIGRANYIAANASDLPGAYQRMIDGTSDAELAESAAAARTQFEADFAQRTGGAKPPNTGSAARPATPAAPANNPYARDTWNYTEQARLEQDNPMKAAELKAAAAT
jgi:hypothetical protein